MEEEGLANRPSTSNHNNDDDIGPSTSSQLPESEPAETEANMSNNNSSSNRRSRRQRGGLSRRFSIPVPSFGSDDMRDDVWSCLIVLMTFWFFACMTLILGFYGSYNVQLGPNSSYLIGANPIFVHSIKAQQLGGRTNGPMLYGFHKSPSLAVKTEWSETYNASVEPNYHSEWAYYLNAGSQVHVSYDVNFPSDAPLSFVIAKGRESLLEWIDDPTYPNITLSWNIVYGSGEISQNIKCSDNYYVAVGNLNSQTAMVGLNISILSVLYNTSNAYFKCSLSKHACSFRLSLMKPNSAVLTSPGPGHEGNDGNNWYIKVSYGPQWITYLCGSCVLTALILVLFRFCSKFQSGGGNQAGHQGTGREATERDPLLSPKGDDALSHGSSYDSISNDEDDLEEKHLDGQDGKVLKEGESNASSRRLCVICFDAPRDCFFLPCGHCAACFTCGSRIAEEAGTCPICRRRMKKVRKIFPV